MPGRTCILGRMCVCVCVHRGHLQGLSPVVALVDGVDHVLVHQAWLLITLPLPFLLAGAGRTGGKRSAGGGHLLKGRGPRGLHGPEILHQHLWEDL